MDNTPEFWDARAVKHKDDIRRAVFDIDESVWHIKLVEARNLIHKVIQPGSKVLDAGCAYGFMSKLMPHGTHYVGVDFSQEFIRKARVRYRNRRFVHADLTKLPFERHEFDWAVVRGFSTDELHVVLEELYRVAKKILVFSTMEPEQYRIITSKIRPKVQDDSPIRVWFPHFFTEAHRQSWQGAALVAALASHGVECFLNMPQGCNLAFCGSFFYHEEFRDKLASLKSLPRVHYNWDLYPFQLEKKHIDYQDRWDTYVEELKQASAIVVPSRCTVERTYEFVGNNIPVHVVRSSVRTFDEPITEPGEYVYDPLRKYPDPNLNLAKDVCRELDIPFVESQNSLPWTLFKHTVACARVIVSTQYEASTGGLTLLEGYALGKPVLMSNSPRHGGIDYFGDRATYFQWDDREDFKNKLLQLWNNPPKGSVNSSRQWVQNEFSEYRMAGELAAVFRSVLGQKPPSLNPSKHIHPYCAIHSHRDEDGYIVWRVGTGLNVELLHIHTPIRRKGHGNRLFGEMMRRLSEGVDAWNHGSGRPMRPFHSVFGFTREDNPGAIEFYRSLGFTLTPVSDVYQVGAILFSAPFTRLLERMKQHDTKL